MGPMHYCQGSQVCTEQLSHAAQSPSAWVSLDMLMWYGLRHAGQVLLALANNCVGLQALQVAASHYVDQPALQVMALLRVGLLG